MADSRQPQADKAKDEAKHIEDARLFCLAVADNLVFRNDEFEHLRQCPECFKQWKRYIHQYLRDDSQQESL
jgi:hypothetical protein